MTLTIEGADWEAEKIIMHILSLRLFVLLFAAVAFFLPLVRATIVSFQGGGTFVYYNGAVQRVPFTVAFSYDDASTPLSTTYDPFGDQAVYQGLSLSYTVNLVEGTWTHAVLDPKIYVFNGQYSDSFQVSGPLNPGAPNFMSAPVDYYGVELVGGQANFSSLALPSVLNAGDWATKNGKIYTNNFGLQYNMPLETLGAASAVPEPSTWAAMAGGLALGVTLWTRRRRRRVAA